jgi:hypothetical protein
MQRPKATAVTPRPHRILIILAAAWMIAALAFGSAAVPAPSSAESSTVTADTVTQP